jgi:hypothetical protein
MMTSRPFHVYLSARARDAAVCRSQRFCAAHGPSNDNLVRDAPLRPDMSKGLLKMKSAGISNKDSRFGSASND